MKKSVIGAALAAIAIVTLNTGCVTSKVQKVDATTGFTNTVVVVNQANLALDSAALQGVTAIAVNTVVNQTHKDPNVVAALKNAKVALDGILGGANQQTTQQVLDLLKLQGNQALADQVTMLVQTASSLEQQLLAKYGQGVAGQISISLLKAISAGLSIGLAGA
jgi:hypothetical protein